MGGGVEAIESHDPWTVFEDWYRAASEARLPLPEALTLATVGLDGRPAARIVLYKGRSGAGLRFFSNYSSRKGKELARVPFAALVFHWAALGRQVRVEGAVEKLSPGESDAYFMSRPRDSQLGAWASPQSEALPSEEVLSARLVELRTRYAHGEVPRPPHWGGYRLLPERFEFWTAAEHRLNERVLFERDAESWRRTLLAP